MYRLFIFKSLEFLHEKAEWCQTLFEGLKSIKPVYNHMY